ncbi:MAG: PAS domain-containing protein [Deltaproteobacteria bacterium]|nr:PAS domain-containing protein [Deltaproteobacteria bacterium]
MNPEERLSLKVWETPERDRKAVQERGAFRELAETIQEVFWVMEPTGGRILYISPAYEQIWGRSCQSLYEQPGRWMDTIHADDRDRIRHATATHPMDDRYDEEYRIVRPDGQLRWVRAQAFPVRNGVGHVERVVGVARDITEGRPIAEQLRQSQKMDAIGQLAGGVAHDFNNILTLMMMQIELIKMVKDLPAEARQHVQDIREAAWRAADLTRQLLLFGRRQVMQPRVLDLNDSVKNLAKMLQRFIGEDVHIQLHLHPTPVVTRADAGMIDQVLMNLAVNARDAMLGGGSLTIATAQVIVDEALSRIHPEAAPGRHVALSVIDTGTGIAAETLAHIFEPFFTTKEPGKGTGLGLATVFGIIKQHRGSIAVDSIPGRGTTFQIILPASEGLPGRPVGDVKARPQELGGGETILLVEDEPAVRLVTRTVLAQYGYRLLEASNGVEALKLWHDHRDSVALLLTDLVMPGGVSGHDLATRLKADRPALKIVYTSGYSAEIAGRRLELSAGEHFLPKPFQLNDLLDMVHRCLTS